MIVLPVLPHNGRDMPQEPTIPDGRQGLLTKDLVHYPNGWRPPYVWGNPEADIGRAVKAGDIMQCSMPLSYGQDDPYGYLVFHYNVQLTAGITDYDVQKFADGLQEEWAQAWGAGTFGQRSILFSSFAKFGPVHVKNLSSPGDEAVANKVWQGNSNEGHGRATLSLRSAVVVRKHTAWAGRGNQGRMYLGGVNETAQRAGRMEGGGPAYVEAAMADLARMNDINGLSGVSAFMVVYSPKQSAGTSAIVTTPVTSVSCAPILGSIRDRVRVR